MTSYKLDPPEAPALTADSEAAPHPGAMIRDELDAAGYSIPGASAAMAVNRPNLNNVILGKASLTRDLAYRLSALLNPDDEAFDLARLLIGIQAQHDWHKDRASRATIRTMVQAGRKSVDKRGKKALEEA
jgi:plasmid maintenance system antidote protein VapI